MAELKGFLNKIPGSFKITFLIVFTLIVFGVISPSNFADLTRSVNVVLFNYFGGYYMIFAFLTLVVLVLIGLSPLGKVRIGGKEAKPEFSYFSWLSMLFCTGMGVGLMFWGVAEPLYHFIYPPIGGESGDYENQITAFKITFLHWGLTPWAIYGLTAIAVSFLGFNLKRGILFSSLLTGKQKAGKEKNTGSKVVDIITIIAIFFGVVASFGMGVLILEGGLEALTSLKSSFGLQLLIIIFATVFYMTSTLRGLDGGIKVLSNISMMLSFVLFGFILWNMPKTQLGQYAIDTTQLYIKDFLDMSLGNFIYNSPDFLREWTVKYWSWWIAWAPFVGIFIAITSFGRTIREIAFSVLLAPTIYSFIWFIVFGTAAFHTQSMTNFPVTLDDAGVMLYNVVEYITKMPLISWLTIFIAAIFFINSADSATYTLASFTKEKNTLSEKPSKYLQISWGLLFSIMTALFLFIGGIYILQEITLIFALPFSVLLLIIFAIFILSLIRYYQENYVKSETVDTPSVKNPAKSTAST